MAVLFGLWHFDLMHYDTQANKRSKPLIFRYVKDYTMNCANDYVLMEHCSGLNSNRKYRSFIGVLFWASSRLIRYGYFVLLFKPNELVFACSASESLKIKFEKELGMLNVERNLNEKKLKHLFLFLFYIFFKRQHLIFIIS